jgi:hypothetical protein
MKKEEEITFQVMTPDELNEWFIKSHSRFSGKDHDAINTMNFFLKMIENWFDDNEQYIDSYEEYVTRELH